MGKVTVNLKDISFTVKELTKQQCLNHLMEISPESNIENGPSKEKFSRFIISYVVVNSEKVHNYLDCVDDLKYSEILFTVMESIYEINPTLDPSILSISSKGIIIPTSICSVGFHLTESASWDPENSDGVYLDDILSDEFKNKNPTNGDDSSSRSWFSTLIPPKHSGIKVVRWNRTNLDLEVKKYNKEDVPELLSNLINKPYDDLIYKTTIIHQTLLNVEHIYLLIDSMGLTQETNLEVINQEIFELCVEVNPFLKVEEIDIEELFKDLGVKPTSKVGKISYKPKKPKKVSNNSGGKDKTQESRKEKFEDVSEESLLTLASRIKSKVIGQDSAVDKIVEAIQISKCGLRDPEKPIAVYMLCGTTGTGKTETAKVLSEELCGDRNAVIRIDCSEYSEGHDTKKLVGAPPSYVGHDEGGFLTKAVTANPFSVVLFDEIEKGHSKLFDILLQIMDDARLTDGKGAVTSFKDCIILFTSNVGVSDTKEISSSMGFGDSSVVTQDKRETAINKALKNKFRPEFLNRIDSVINFKSLNEQSTIKIIDILLNKIKGYVKNKNISVEFDKSIHDMIFKGGFSKEYGARPLEREIEKKVVKQLAKNILNKSIRSGDKILLSYKNDELAITVVD